LADEAQRRFDAGSHAAARTAGAAALALVRGGLLADERDAPWLEVERAAVDRHVARVRHLCARAALASGDPSDAAELAQQALDHDPYDEDALRCLMYACAAAGRPASALAAYARARERLSDDLGVSPSAETEAVHNAILRDEPLTDANPPRAALPALIGRDRQLAALDAAASGATRGEACVVVVTGDAGIGKSTLLTAWAERARATGFVVLAGAADELARSLPLQPLVDAIERHLRAAGRSAADDLLDNDRALLSPLFGRHRAGATATPPALVDGLVGPAALYGALATLLERIGRGQPVALLLDDMHRAGGALGDWCAFVQRRAQPLMIVAAARTGEPVPLVPDVIVEVGPFDLDDTINLVGGDAARAAQLHDRSGGNPLFLSELATADDATLPSTIRASVAARCDRLGPAGATLRAAAVLGRTIDIDLLAAVIRTDTLLLLEHLEEGARHGFLEETGDTLSFRHDLVREAVAAATPATRAALLHREAGRALASRSHAEPLDVAYHARLGGDTDLAARALVDAAAIAGARFDQASAEALLDQAIALREDAPILLARARVRIMRTHYSAADADIERALALGAGADALEIAGWSAYYARDLDAAKRNADDGARLAVDDASRGRCLALAGRVRHGQGDLADAQQLLESANRTTQGADNVVAAAWLGVLRSHQSRADDALALLMPATRLGAGRETTVMLHALIFGGHALALSGRPREAIALLDRYEQEAQERQVDRFFGRGHNFAAWVLRSIGDEPQAHDRNEAALATGGVAIRETYIAAHLDLADAALRAGDPDRAHRELALARDGLDSSDRLIFKWRQELKRQWLDARLAFALGAYDDAEALAATLAQRAGELGIPRYAVPARLLLARSRARAGRRGAVEAAVDLAAVEHDLGELPAAVALEAWWLTGEVARDLHVARWFDVAAERADGLATNAGDHADTLRADAARTLTAWRDAARV
ncbi:MAG: putative DNA-binding protein, partial [Actinomycetia bacterium]|nr:putative DNA-binding protein [Actinomycetes bacterium]